MGRGIALTGIYHNPDDGTIQNEWAVYKMDTVIIIAIIGAIPGLIALILQFKKNKVEERESDSNIAEKITGAAGVIMDKMQAQITHCETEIKCLELRIEAQDNEIARLRKGIIKLVTQIKKYDEPCWTPDIETVK